MSKAHSYQIGGYSCKEALKSLTQLVQELKSLKI